METFYYFEKALLSLTKAEHKRFEKFLRADYFKKKHSHHSAVFLFYMLIKINILKPRNKKFTVAEWDIIIKDIYAYKKNDSAFCKRRLILLKSELLSYLMDFINIETTLRDKAKFKISLLNELINRNLLDIFDHFCKAKHFKEIDPNYTEPDASNLYWKLIKTANRRKERNGFITEDIDYDIEKMLLRKYLRSELNELNKRLPPPPQIFLVDINQVKFLSAISLPG
jgi:hypothetical protein